MRGFVAETYLVYTQNLEVSVAWIPGYRHNLSRTGVLLKYRSAYLCQLILTSTFWRDYLRVIIFGNFDFILAMAATRYYFTALFVNFILFYGCFSEVRQSLPADTGRDNYIFPKIKLFDRKVRSILDCAASCTNDKSCLAFTIVAGASNPGRCLGYRTTVTSDTPDAEAADGAKTFNMGEKLRII